MRAVVQRVLRASVQVEHRVTGSVGRGLLALLGVAADDDERDSAWMAEKLGHLRIFPDERGMMNRSAVEIRAAVLLVSQFTLHGDARRGRRPSFVAAAREDRAKPLYELVGSLLNTVGLQVAYGEFGADMQVELVNDGPVTILLDSKRAF